MANETQLPYLLKLLDDDSPVVQEAILKELRALGPRLEEALIHLPEPPTPIQKKVLQDILQAESRQWLQEAWSSWFFLKGEKAKLEMAMSLLAQFQYERNGVHPPLESLLDDLAHEYLTLYEKKDASKLAEFLFQTKKLKGAPSDTIEPLHSNLMYVLEKKLGLPISLTIIYILVGHRLSMEIEGCNFPRHFLARVSLEGKIFLVDCFNGGKFIDPKEIIKINQNLSPVTYDILQNIPSATAIISRVLRNLIHAYREKEEHANGKLMMVLLEDLEENNNSFK
ncbi:MAG: hypothetical protein HYS07_06050 [Chlamydiae bacterium]|nr:hypothetical protein [Chlamydiota bacterium]MBI3277232.1 hypothetical protein [Chlamydiota bacterium]